MLANEFFRVLEVPKAMLAPGVAAPAVVVWRVVKDLIADFFH